MSASCASPFGADSTVERPSWLTAEPRITPWMRSSSAIASDRRLRTTIPHPSPRAKPSAEASNVLQRPSGAMNPTLDIATVSSGVIISETPPAIARSVSPDRRLSQARWIATSDEEQALSIDRLGPRRSSR